MYNLDEILIQSVKVKASDIHLTTGRPPSYRIDGVLTPIEGERLTPQMLEDILMPLMYQVPSDYTIEKVVITKETVEDGAAPQITYNKERKPVKIKITQPKRRDRRDSVS